MFKSLLPELAKKHGIINAHQLSKHLGLAASTTNRLWNGEFDRVAVETLHKICEAFDCQISDILFFVKDS